MVALAASVAAHARPAAKSMVLPTRDRRHGTPLPDNAFECFDRARGRMS
jgi:hypothetical protein